jgi:hypothetical protein
MTRSYFTRCEEEAGRVVTRSLERSVALRADNGAYADSFEAETSCLLLLCPQSRDQAGGVTYRTGKHVTEAGER